MFLAHLRQLLAYRFDERALETSPEITKNPISLILLIALLSSTNGLNAQEESDELTWSQDTPSTLSGQPRIVGGSVAEVAEWPSLVALVIPGQMSLRARQFCGGSVVADRWVLTAAHCLFNLDGSRTTTDQIRIVAGINDLEDEAAIETVVSNIYIHPQYETSSIPVHDIALLELGTSVPVAQNALANADPETLVGRMAFIAGWGALTEDGPITDEQFPNLLQDASVPIISLEQCNVPESYDGNLLPIHLCAGFRQGGVDSCQGDSGGPLYILEGSQQVQIGVTSFGAGCARADLYGVYTNVEMYRDWMGNYFDLNARAVTVGAAAVGDGGEFAGSTHPLFLTILAGFTIFLLIRASINKGGRRLFFLAAALLSASACSSYLPATGNVDGAYENPSSESEVSVTDVEKVLKEGSTTLSLSGDDGKVGVNQLLLGSTRLQTFEALQGLRFAAPLCQADKTAIKGTGRLFLRENCTALTSDAVTLEGLDISDIKFQLLDDRLIKLEIHLQSGDAMALVNQLNLRYNHVPSAERPLEWRLNGNHIRIVSVDVAAVDGVSDMSLQMIDGRLLDKLPKLFDYRQ